jgi:hypothetical protein
MVAIFKYRMSTVSLAGSECAFNCHLLAPQASPSSTVGPFFYSMEPPRASIIGWHGLWSSQRDERMEGGHRGPSVTSESARRGAVEGVPAARGRRRRPGLQRRGAGPAGPPSARTAPPAAAARPARRRRPRDPGPAGSRGAQARSAAAGTSIAAGLEGRERRAVFDGPCST